MPEYLVPDLSNITATAVLGWYAWHTASRTIPGLLDAFRQELSAIRAEHRAETESFREEMAAERLARQEDHQAIVAALNELATRFSPLRA